MSECRGCGRPVKWAVLEETGRPFPLDPEPVEGGNVVVRRGGDGELLARVVAVDPGMVRYVTHFSTCPDAEEFRRPGQTSLPL